MKKMDKSLGNKRNELSDEHIKALVQLYAAHAHNGQSEVLETVEGKPQTVQRICSKIFDNREFGFLKITVERPLRLNFQVSAARIARLDEQSAFANLASSKKRKDDAAYQAEVAAGQASQENIKAALLEVASDTLYTHRAEFEQLLVDTLQDAGLNKVGAPIRKAILAALSERDPAVSSAWAKRCGWPISRPTPGWTRPAPHAMATTA